LDFLTNSVPPPPSENPRIIWRLGKLVEEKVRNKYIDQFQSNSTILSQMRDATIQPQQRTEAANLIENFSSTLCTAIYGALDSSCGRKEHWNNYMHDLWTKKMQAALDYREKCYRKWRRADGLNKLSFWIEHQQAKAATRRLIKQRQRFVWRRYCQKLASDDYGNTIRHISSIKRNRKIAPTFTLPEGAQMASNAMASHLETIFYG
ncbi:uncharacterized protein B0P05DRAFT_449141, partial [Gilbertella persicaria]|uniref:uncharacterized protein n=1 Tax=Gilbertella persicaria TaxID=101096 RepID=UPI00221F212D